MKKSFAILFIAILAMSINNYSFSQVTVTPGPATNYADLKLAFDAINAGTHGAGAISVSINASHALSDSAVLKGGVFTSCTIMPTAVVTVSLGAAKTLIRLNGADNVTIDGRIGGIGSTISLTLTNSDAGGVAALASTIQMINAANNNIVRYCNLNLTVITASGVLGGYNVNIGVLVPGTSGNNDNTVEFCVVNGGQRGIQTVGNNSATVGYTNNRTTIRNNKVKNWVQLGIFSGTGSKDNVITQNEIFNDNPATFAANQTRAINIQGLGTEDATRNYIHDQTYAGYTPPLTSAGSVGIISIPVITVIPGAPTTATVNMVNNMVSINSNADANFSYGLFPASTAAPNSVINYIANVYYNSIRLFGSSGATAGADTRGIVQAMTGSGSVYNQFNNVVRNDRTGGGAGTFHIGADLNPQFAASPDSTMTLNSDYNTVWASDVVNGWDAGFNGTVYAGGAQQYRDSVASSNIQDGNFTVENSELHTAFRAVDFVSNTDLHLVASLVGGDMNARPFPAVTTIDIDGDSRNGTFPFRGADEIVSTLDGPPPVFKLLTLGYALEAITPSTTDVITLELRNSTTGALITSSTATLPATPGNTAVFAFGALISDCPTLYYLRIIHRNSIALWSATTQCFTGGALSYDFTDALAKAYHNVSVTNNAMKLVGTEWSAYTGDVIQDGIVDGSDLVAVDNLQKSSSGNPVAYVRQDLNFNNVCDNQDISFCFNNQHLEVLEQSPFPAPLILNYNNSSDRNKSETSVYHSRINLDKNKFEK